MKYVLSCFWSIIVFTACPPGATDDTATQTTDAGVHTTDAGSGPCEQSEEVCGVAPRGESYLCEDGETWAGPGPCERNEDGTCQWTFVRCPEEQ